jgi:hypothetical protein
MRRATNADVVDKLVSVKLETQPSDPEVQACHAEVAATLSNTYINFPVALFELSDASSSKLCCSAPGALDANDGAENEEATVTMQRG